MGAIEIFIVLLGIAMAILNIMLFFKLWEMTNDVKEIKNYLLKK